MNKPTPFDASIPVLTEVIDETPGVATPGVGTPGVATPGVATPGVATPPASAAPVRAAEWADLEQRITERIVRQLAGQLDTMIEQRVRASMRTVLDSASALLASEVRRGMYDALQQAVARAVADELARAPLPPQP